MRVISVTQQIDLSGTVGKVVAGVLFGLAEIELTHIRERQAAGIAEAKAKGVYKGRKKGTLKADPARARELKAKGMKLAEIMQVAWDRVQDDAEPIFERSVGVQTNSIASMSCLYGFRVRAINVGFVDKGYPELD